MTLRLILVRHAKSSWDDPFSDDHARILNGRGRASAQAVGAWLSGQGYVPDTVCSSDAARTKETAELIIPCFPTPPPLRLAKALYHASPDTVLGTIGRETAKTVAIVGHNPGIGMLANMLVARPPGHHRFIDYPTCATTVIDFAASAWGAVRPRAGTCIAFIVPRDLIGTTGQEID